MLVYSSLFVLALVIVIAVYLICFNEKKIEEKFDVPDNNVPDNEYHNSISKIFAEYLIRPPELFELERYRILMAFSTDVDPVVETIKKTVEYKDIVNVATAIDTKPSNATLEALTDIKSPLNVAFDAMSFTDRMETYRTIVQVYEKDLQRMPTSRELNYYSYRMMTDKQFNSNRLSQVLESSQEYNMIQKNQSNVVNGELPGNITDAQMTFEVRRIYAKVYGHEMLPSSVDFEKFLKIKYHDYQLIEEKLVNLLLMLKSVDDETLSGKLVNGKITFNVAEEACANKIAKYNNVNNTIVTQESSVKSVKTESNTESSSNKESSKVEEESTTSDKTSSDKTSSDKTSSDKICSACSNKKSDNDLIAKQDQINKKGCKNPYGKKYVDPVYENIKRAQKEANEEMTCGFDMKANRGNSSLLSEYQNDRNADELGVSCERNSYFLQDGQDMVLDPRFEWTVPQMRPPVCTNRTCDVYPQIGQTALIGTLLADADNTKVGSIMPPFIYSEGAY